MNCHLLMTGQICAYLQHRDRPISNGQPFSLSLQIKRIQELWDITDSWYEAMVRMGCKNVPEGSGGPGALLWGLSLSDSPSMVLLLISSGPEQAPWMLGVAENMSLLHSTLGWRGAARAGLRVLPLGLPSGHPTGGMLRDTWPTSGCCHTLHWREPWFGMVQR